MDLSNVINVGILLEGKAVSPDNMNTVCIMSSEEPLNTNERYRVYKSISAVESDFGTYSSTYAFANVVFQQTPNPINIGGALIVGYYRSIDEDVDATSGILTGSQINEAQVISNLQQITDGSMVIKIDDSDVTLSNLDFSTSITIDDVVALINDIVGATCTFSDQRFIFTSETNGVTSTMSTAFASPTGIFIGSILGLSNGATIINGEDAQTLTAESKVEAISEVKSLVNFKGFCFIDNTTDAESESLADWTQEKAVLSYDVFSDTNNLEVDDSNPVWNITNKSQNKYIMLYSTDRRLAAGVMARQHTVNFGSDTANTINLKDIKGVEAVDYSQTVWNKAETIGLSLYTFFKGIPKLITSGANGWSDDTYNIIAFIDHIQVDVFNVLGSTPTKISQTLQGVNQIVDQCEKTTRQFVRSEVFAAGTWTGDDYFGERAVFDRNIEQNGYYWLAGRLEDQPISERQARKSPLIQGAVKNAGAIHGGDILINFNL